MLIRQAKIGLRKDRIPVSGNFLGKELPASDLAKNRAVFIQMCNVC